MTGSGYPGRMVRFALGIRLSLPPIFWVALLPFGFLVHRFLFVCDDAYISFRYAKNFAHGLGLTFNPGNVDGPVEGYTNFLWVLLMAAGEIMGVAAPVFSLILSIACGAGLLLLVGQFLSEPSRGGSQSTAVIGGLLFATFPPLAMWSTGGLATMSVALALTGLFAALWLDPTRPRLGLGLACAACGVLLRADGIGVVGLILATSGLVAWGSQRAALRKAVILIGVASLALFGAHAAFRLSYYGDWLPNTARAKVTLDELPETLKHGIQIRGTNYLIAFVLTFPSVVLGVLGPLLLLGRNRSQRTWVIPAVLTICGHWLYARQVGGDFMAMGRFLVPTLPLIVLVSAMLLGRVWAASRPVGVLLVGAGICVSLAPAWNHHAVPYETRVAYHFRWNHRIEDVKSGEKRMQSEYERWHDMCVNVDHWVLVGKAMSLFTKPTESLAAGGVGAIGYYCDIYLYDTYGLTNKALMLRPPPIKRLRSPGHDRFAPPEFFHDRSLTFLSAGLCKAMLLHKLPARIKYTHPAFKHLAKNIDPDQVPCTLEVHPLNDVDGFPEDETLILQRVDL